MSESDQSCPTAGLFGWNELLSTDVEGSKTFYTKLFGWTTETFGEGYTLFNCPNIEDRPAAGLMKAPRPGMPAQWLPYVLVEDVDASAARVRELGGEVMKEAFDIPDVGRIAVLRDPQGACIGLFKPLGG